MKPSRRLKQAAASRPSSSSSSMPWVVGGLCLVVGGGLFMASQGNRPAPARRESGHGSDLAAPARRDAGEQSNESKYIEGRSRDLLSESLRGLPSSSVSDETLERFRATAKKQAAREWTAISKVYDMAAVMGRERNEPDVYKAAAGLVADVARDLGRYGQTPTDEAIKSMLELAADKVRLEARVRR